MKQYRYPSPIIAERIQKIFDDNDLTDGYVAKAINVDRKTIFSFRHTRSFSTRLLLCAERILSQRISELS